MLRIFAFVVLILAFTNAFAQEGNSPKERFDASFGRGLKKFAGKSNRRIIISEDKIDGIREESLRDIVEIDQAGSTRVISQFSLRFNKLKVERIRSGAINYVREGDGKWRQEPIYSSEDTAKWREAAGQSEPLNRPKVIDEQKEYKFFGFEMLDGKKVSVGGFISKSKTINPADNTEILLTSTFKVWFGERETILKTESYTERKKGEKTTYRWRTETYEFDPNIKIEIPVLN